jgi:hypothetical protein
MKRRAGNDFIGLMGVMGVVAGGIAGAALSGGSFGGIFVGVVLGLMFGAAILGLGLIMLFCAVFAALLYFFWGYRMWSPVVLAVMVVLWYVYKHTRRAALNRGNPGLGLLGEEKPSNAIDQRAALLSCNGSPIITRKIVDDVNATLKRGSTVKAAALEAGLSTSTVYRIRNGKYIRSSLPE